VNNAIQSNAFVSSVLLSSRHVPKLYTIARFGNNSADHPGGPGVSYQQQQSPNKNIPVSTMIHMLNKNNEYNQFQIDYYPASNARRFYKTNSYFEEFKKLAQDPISYRYTRNSFDEGLLSLQTKGQKLLNNPKRSDQLVTKVKNQKTQIANLNITDDVPK
jgi:spore germination protein GerM